MSEGPLPIAPLHSRDALPFSSELWHSASQKTGTKSVFIPREGWWVRYLTSWIKKDASKSGSPSLPQRGCEQGLVFKVYGRCRGLLCAGGRKAGRDVVGCLLSVQGAARCACIPAGLESHACVYPDFLLRMGNLGIAASRGSPASMSADKSVSCV